MNYTQNPILLVIAGILMGAIISLGIGKGIITLLKRYRFRQIIYEDAPQRHKEKEGTPTGGGIIILLSLVCSGLFFYFLYKPVQTNLFLVLMLMTFCFGLLGFLDDHIAVTKSRPLGLKARYKLIGQIVLAAIFVVLLLPPIFEIRGSTFAVRGLMGGWFHFGWFYFPFAIFLIAGLVNAVNLTDGLDGLCCGLGIITFSIYIFLLFMWFSRVLARKALMSYGMSEAIIFCSILSGTCLGFLWYNRYPAKVFMGDTGSMALGGALAAMAILTKTELLMLLIGGVFVIEALSVVIQVIYFKLSGGKRIFKMSPLHHHFELLGWSEQQIVTRFWLAGIFLGLLGLIAAVVI